MLRLYVSIRLLVFIENMKLYPLESFVLIPYISVIIRNRNVSMHPFFFFLSYQYGTLISMFWVKKIFKYQERKRQVEVRKYECNRINRFSDKMHMYYVHDHAYVQSKANSKCLTNIHKLIGV